MKLLLSLFFIFGLTGSPTVNSYQFSCSNDLENSIKKYELLIRITDKFIIEKFPPVKVTFHYYRESYGKVLLRFNVNDNGVAQDIEIAAQCPHRAFVKYAKNTLLKYKFKKSEIDKLYEGMVVIQF